MRLPFRREKEGGKKPDAFLRETFLEAVRENWKLGASDRQVKDVTRYLTKRPLVPQQQGHVKCKWPRETYFGDIRYRPFDQDLRSRYMWYTVRSLEARSRWGNRLQVWLQVSMRTNN